MWVPLCNTVEFHKTCHVEHYPTHLKQAVKIIMKLYAALLLQTTIEKRGQ